MTVIKALLEFVARWRRKRLLALVGKLEWDSSYDYKTERTRDQASAGSPHAWRDDTSH